MERVNTNSPLLAGLAMLVGAGQLFGGPAITGFTPTIGSYNDPSYIRIDGSGFANVALIVKFNGVQDFGANATTANQIQTRVPTNAPLGSGPIFVSVNGAGVLSADDFIVIGPGPYI